MASVLAPPVGCLLGEDAVAEEQRRCGPSWTVGWSKTHLMVYYKRHFELNGQATEVEVWAKDGPPQQHELNNPNVVWQRVQELRLAKQRRNSRNTTIISPANASTIPVLPRRSLPSTPSSSLMRVSASRAATVHADYLDTLAQSHSDFLFGAFAELLHNAVDSGATDVRIELAERCKGRFASDMLEIRDNGRGMSRAELERMMRFGKERRLTDKDVVAKYGIGFKSGAARLCHNTTVVTRKQPQPDQSQSHSAVDESSLYFVSLLNPGCADSDGNLLAPLMVIDADTAKVHDDASKDAQLLIQQHTEVDPVRWVLTFAQPDGRRHGTSVYLQSLKGEKSARNLADVPDDEVEWKVLEQQHDIVHARGDKFQRTRDAQQLAEVIRMDFSLRAYMEVMYLQLPLTVQLTLLGEKVDTRSLLDGAHEFQLQRTYAIPAPRSLPVKAASTASRLHMGYSAQLHREALCGAHIYWRNILIESFLHVGYNRTSIDDHGFLGLVELRDDWDLDPLNHKQGFPKSSPRYAQLKECVGNLWREHVAQCKKKESQSVPEHAALKAALSTIKELAPGTARHEAAVAAWMLYQGFQVRRWANDYDSAELRDAADHGTHLQLAELLVRHEVLPPSLRKMQRFIANIDEDSNTFLQCDKCDLDRRVPNVVAKRFSKGTWTCATSSELHLQCGKQRPEDIMDQDEAVVQERQEGVALGNGGFHHVHTSHTAAPNLLEVPSSEIDIYRDQPLGSGSHGTVFLAKWRGVDVAVKVLRSDGQVDRRLIASFKDEVRVLAALQHPLLIRMLFFNKEQLAIGLEYLKEFVPLPSVLQADRNGEEKPPLESVVKVLLDVAKGIAFMHSHDCLHRDLCPANVLLRCSDWSVKILDFGLATWLRKEQRAQATRERTGQPDVGTATYKAPERFRSEPLSKASDVFSFAIMAWALLAHEQQPWDTFKRKEGELSYDVIQRAITTDKRPPMQPLIDVGCPAPLLELVERCWHPSQDKRPSMDEVVLRLESQLHSLLQGLEAFRRRHHGGTLVYRVLHRDDEQRLAAGLPLQAANPQSTVSVRMHVRFGSMRHSQPSPFMSTTLSFSWALHYAATLLRRAHCESCSRGSAPSAESSGGTHTSSTIVAIALDELPTAAWDAVFDVTTARLADLYDLEYQAKNYAVDSQEVLLSVPVPSSLIKQRYRVLPEHVSNTDEGVANLNNPQLPRIWNDSKQKAVKYKDWIRNFNRAFEPNMAALKQQLKERTPKHMPARSITHSSTVPPPVRSSNASLSVSSSTSSSSRLAHPGVSIGSTTSVSLQSTTKKTAGTKRRSRRSVENDDSDSDCQPGDNEPLLEPSMAKRRNGKKDSSNGH
jgi:serine/threonine protein kinase